MAKYLYGTSIQGIQEYIYATGSWKEQTKQKRPEKDRVYQDTLKIMAMLKEFEK